jgi:hypothetical protein
LTHRTRVFPTSFRDGQEFLNFYKFETSTDDKTLSSLGDTRPIHFD